MRKTVWRSGIPFEDAAWIRSILGVLLVALGMVGLLFSRASLSICMIGLLVDNLIDFTIQRGFSLRLRPGLPSLIRRFIRHPGFAPLTLVLLWVVFTGTYSEDQNYWLERVRLKLPFLALPFAFFAFEHFTVKMVYGLLYAWIFIMVMSCMGVEVYFWSHQESVLEAMQKGKPMPTPGHHIRFSLLVALAGLTACILWWKSFYFRWPWERWILLALGIYLIYHLHFLSVRSGMVTFYGAAGVLLLVKIVPGLPWWKSLTILLGLLCIPILAYWALPSLQTKISYVWWDLKMYQQGQGAGYSDSDRIRSLQIGYEIAREHPWWGVGAGDLKGEVHRIYDERFPEQEVRKMPHNQFLSTWAGMGLVGFLVFCWAFFRPWYHFGKGNHLLLWSIYLILTFSFLTENTIENAMGIGIATLFTGLFLRLSEENSKIDLKADS